MTRRVHDDVAFPVSWYWFPFIPTVSETTPSGDNREWATKAKQTPKQENARIDRSILRTDLNVFAPPLPLLPSVCTQTTARPSVRHREVVQESTNGKKKIIRKEQRGKQTRLLGGQKVPSSIASHIFSISLSLFVLLLSFVSFLVSFPFVSCENNGLLN